MERYLAAAQKISVELWDPDLGLLQRYLPFAEDPGVHVHAGNGPWLAYSAIYAGYLAKTRRADEAERVLRLVAARATPEGALPEHLSTRERFFDWWDREWETGVDFQKEFAKDILLPGVGFSRVVEELSHMRAEYERLRTHLDTTTDDIIRFATPLLWSHAEFLLALFALKDARAGAAA
jgi:GH15 family glucan-1,4-alpha-glucosidase